MISSQHDGNKWLAAIVHVACVATCFVILSLNIMVFKIGGTKVPHWVFLVDASWSFVTTSVFLCWYTVPTMLDLFKGRCEWSFAVFGQLILGLCFGVMTLFFLLVLGIWWLAKVDLITEPDPFLLGRVAAEALLKAVVFLYLTITICGKLHNQTQYAEISNISPIAVAGNGREGGATPATISITTTTVDLFNVESQQNVQQSEVFV
mmetsp:Transcript_5705/g.7494  ORF Transcript_5705/g.7494 Transcript_5705/m.7494 type:complete len:206 (+) Transcript_5705:265-882(+)